MSDEFFSPGSFDGTARLFPLPNVVLFPHVLMPLHIFEPRYRQLTDDALKGDRLISLALLRPGWEEHYEGKPPLHVIACLGKILAEQRLDDGRYNILLRGVSRVRITKEIEHDKLYRSARVELLEDEDMPSAKETKALRKEMGKQMKPWFEAVGVGGAELKKLLKSDLPLGTLCDVLSFALPFEVAFKQELLEELAVTPRVQKLLAHLEMTTPPPPAPPSLRTFPPEFSDN